MTDIFQIQSGYVRTALAMEKYTECFCVFVCSSLCCLFLYSSPFFLSVIVFNAFSPAKIMKVCGRHGLLTLGHTSSFYPWTTGLNESLFVFGAQQAEHEDDMFYEEDEIFGEEHEGWPCLEW